MSTIQRVPNNLFDPQLHTSQPVAVISMDDLMYKKLSLKKADEYASSMLSQTMTNALIPHMRMVHRCESLMTGELYEGLYDYIPADDPMCKHVWEARVKTFADQDQIIRDLRIELDRTRQRLQAYTRGMS